MSRIKTKYPGVYQRILENRLYKGKPDVCYDITFKLGPRKVWEKIGLLSEGYSPKLANDVRAERLRSIRHGEELPSKKRAPLFKELAGKYLEWARQNKKSYFSDQHRYKNHLAPYLDNKAIDQITPFYLEKIKNELRKKQSARGSELSPATVKHALVLLRQMLNKALIWYSDIYKGPNPVKAIKLPTLENQRERFFSYEEAELKGLS